MARRRRSGLLTINHPVTGELITVQTPKGTIPADKLVRAFQKARTVRPDGSVRLSSKPVQAVLEPYSEQLEQAAETLRQMQRFPKRDWEEQGLNDNGWIQFRRVLRKLNEAFIALPASS